MGKLIMIVDDSASLRQVVGIALRGAGYEVLEASDGRDALGKLKGQKVHLIVSDVNMPNMDGCALTAALRALPAYAGTPILILTTESSDELKQRGRAAGASGWLMKPSASRSAIRPSRSMVARICSEPGEMSSSTFAFKPFAAAWRATDAARVMSS